MYKVFTMYKVYTMCRVYTMYTRHKVYIMKLLEQDLLLWYNLKNQYIEEFGTRQAFQFNNHQ